MMRCLTSVARSALAVTALALVGGVWASTPTRSLGDWHPTDAVATDPAALTPPDELRDQLTGLGHVPGRDALDPLLGADPAATLIDIATATDLDPGLRLGALRALALYPDQRAEAALTATVTELVPRTAGVDLLYLRTAMKSLAVIGQGGAVHTIRPALDHPSKDVRAAAATALGATGSDAASPWLYERLGVELDEMVRLALSDAIRALDQS